MKFLFQTTICPKPYNSKYYWIDSKCIPQTAIEAENWHQAMFSFVEFAHEHGVDITLTALKNRTPMYRDMPDGSFKQIGFVITGHTIVYGDGDDYFTSKEYTCEVWVGIQKIDDINFEEE